MATWSTIDNYGDRLEVYKSEVTGMTYLTISPQGSEHDECVELNPAQVESLAEYLST